MFAEKQLCARRSIWGNCQTKYNTEKEVQNSATLKEKVKIA